MKASEWIDRAKTIKGWESDYVVAQQLGITRGGLSQIRTGKTATLGEELALKLASAIGENPGAIVLDQAAEKAKDPNLRSTLFDAARRLCVLC